MIALAIIELAKHLCELSEHILQIHGAVIAAIVAIAITSQHIFERTHDLIRIDCLLKALIRRT